MAVDPGVRRIGLALSDPEELLALAWKTIQLPHQADNATVIELIVKAVEESEAEQVILGEARRLSGKAGPEAKAAQVLAEQLRQRGLDVILRDERLTTAAATRLLQDRGLSRKKRQPIIDSFAAEQLLDTYLQERRRLGIKP